MGETYRVHCDECGRKLTLGEKHVGRRVQCRCGAVMRIVVETPELTNTENSAPTADGAKSSIDNPARTSTKPPKSPDGSVSLRPTGNAGGPVAQDPAANKLEPIHFDPFAPSAPARSSLAMPTHPAHQQRGPSPHQLSDPPKAAAETLSNHLRITRPRRHVNGKSSGSNWTSKNKTELMSKPANRVGLSGAWQAVLLACCCWPASWPLFC